MIPIVGVVNCVTASIILAVVGLIWFRHRISLSPLVKAIIGFLVATDLIIWFNALPGVLVNDPAIIQFVTVLGDFFIYFEAVFAFRIFLAFTEVSYKPLSTYFTLAIILLGLGVLSWKITVLSPSLPYIVPDTSFLLYQDTSPSLANNISGIVVFLVIAPVIVIFFYNVFKLKERVLKIRSFLFGLALMFFMMAGIFGSNIGTNPNLIIFLIAAAASGFLGSITFLLAFMRRFEAYS